MPKSQETNELGIDPEADARRFALFVGVLVALLGLGAFLVLGVLVYEFNTPDERPVAPPKQALPGFAPPDTPPAP